MSLRLRGLRCTCEGDLSKVYPSDHYSLQSAVPCRKPPMPLAWIRGLLADEQGDSFHAGNRQTITRALSCPRVTAIQDNLEIVADLRKLDSPRKGTAVHRSWNSTERRTMRSYLFHLRGR